MAACNPRAPCPLLQAAAARAAAAAAPAPWRAPRPPSREELVLRFKELLVHVGVSDEEHAVHIECPDVQMPGVQVLHQRSFLLRAVMV